MYKDPLSRCIMDIVDSSSQKTSIDNLYASVYSTEDMFAFFRQLMGKFFEQAKKNDKLFLELLFFKEKKTIFCLGEESGGYDMLKIDENNSKKKVAWTQDEQDELKELFDKFKPKFENPDCEDPAGPFDGDLIDQIMMNISDGMKKRRDICNQLVNMGCVASLDEFKSVKFTNGAKKLGRNKIWRPEDHEDLKQCFQLVSEDLKQTGGPRSQLMQRLQDCVKIKRNKTAIADKLVQLGVIKDKSEVLSAKPKSNSDFIEENESGDEQVMEKKKKKKKSKKSKSSDSNDLFDAESGSSSGSSSEESSSEEEQVVEVEKENNSEDEEHLDKTKSKKRKKTTKFRILDDDSNLGEAPTVNASNGVLAEIVNNLDVETSKETNLVRLNYNDIYNRINTKDDDDEDEETSDDDDDEMPLSVKISKPKRQRLILSDGDDD